MNEGINELEEVTEETEETEALASEYEVMNENKKYIINLFITWVFLYGMWMGFWKGPGHPLPLRRIELDEENKWRQAQKCEQDDRDEYI